METEKNVKGFISHSVPYFRQFFRFYTAIVIAHHTRCYRYYAADCRLQSLEREREVCFSEYLY